MQRRHSIRHLCLRGGVAAVSSALMWSGLYPAFPHAWRALSRHDLGDHPVRGALVEWALSAALSLARPAGFLPLPGARTRGPRPIILLHGYAMNRAGFLPLAFPLRAAGLGPLLWVQYWTPGLTDTAAPLLALVL